MAVSLTADAKHFARSMQQATADLAKLGKSAESTGRTVDAAMGKAGKAGNEVAKSTSAAARATQTGSKAIATAWTAAGIATTAAVVGLVRETLSFEQAMRNVNTIAHKSDQDFATMSNQVLEMSKSFRVSATDLADGLYDIQSSGITDSSDAMKVLGASATAASAGLTDTATASRVITASLNAYGLSANDAEHVSNVLFKGVEAGVITFEDMATSLSNAIPAAAAAGVSIEELTAGVSSMTLAGIGAAESSTSMGRMIEAILTPTDDLSTALGNLGYQSGSQALKTDGLAVVMGKLQDASQGNIDVLLKWFPEIRAARGAMALMSNEGETYLGVQEQVAKADEGAGAAKRAMAEQMKATTAQVALFVQGIKAGAIGALMKLLPLVGDGIELLKDFGGSVADLAEEAAQRLRPAWEAAGGVFEDLQVIVKALWEAAKPIAQTFGAIVGGTVITGINAMATALGKVTGFLSDHPALIKAIGVAMATYAVAKTISWATELARTSPVLNGLVKTVSGFGGTVKAGAQLMAEGFSGAFSSAGGGIKGLKDGIAGAGSALGAMGSGAPAMLNPIGLAAAAAAIAITGIALAWQDSQEAAENAKIAAQEYGKIVTEGLQAGKPVTAQETFAELTVTPDSQLGQITQQAEFKKAMDAAGITFDEFSKELAKSGSAGELMFAKLAASATNYDSIMESVAGSSDVSDGLQRLGKIGAENLEELTRAGGPAIDRVKEIIAAEKAQALAAGEYATEYTDYTNASTKEHKERVQQLKEQGLFVGEVSDAEKDYIISKKKGEADMQVVYARTIERMNAERIGIDKNGQAVKVLTQEQKDLAEATGVGEERVKGMTAAQQQQLALLNQLEPAAAELTQKLSGAGFGATPALADLQGQLTAAIPILRDGSVTAAELAGYADQMGLSAEQAGQKLGLMADSTAKAAANLTAAFPTLGEAAQNVTIPVEDLDGKLQNVQMTADNFSLDKLLEEQQKLIDAQLAANENMATLLKDGQQAIVAQAQSMPPELRGAFLSAVMEMPAEKRAELEQRFLSQQSNLADSGARLVEAGYGTLDLATPTVQAAITARGGMVNELGQPIDTPVYVSADTAAAEQAISDAARDRESTIYVTEQRTIVDAGGWAAVQEFHGRHGMVLSYAAGGLLSPHIAKAGADIVRYAEPATGGEAFIPRNTSRDRALGILQIAAGWHNAQVIPMASGGIMGPLTTTSNPGGVGAVYNSTAIEFSPRIEINGTNMTGPEIVRTLKGSVGELGEMLRREATGRR